MISPRFFCIPGPMHRAAVSANGLGEIGKTLIQPGKGSFFDLPRQVAKGVTLWVLGEGLVPAPHDLESRFRQRVLKLLIGEGLPYIGREAIGAELHDSSPASTCATCTARSPLPRLRKAPSRCIRQPQSVANQNLRAGRFERVELIVQHGLRKLRHLDREGTAKAATNIGPRKFYQVQTVHLPQ